MARQVFVSYKRNHAASEAAVRAIESAVGGDIRILRDVDMGPGRPWSAELYRWLLECDAGIALVSDESNQADWCRREWTVLAARQQTSGLPVFPLHLGERVITTGILDDLQGMLWEGAALARLLAELSRLPARQSSPEDFLAAHHAWLRWQFNEAPVLGQEPYALADVYIETECGQLTWGDINEVKPGERVDAFHPSRGRRTALVPSALNLVADSKFHDLIVVQAGPGSGKSAFTWRIANALLDEGFWPVLVRFRDLRLATFPDIGELLDDAIRIGGTDDDSPHAQTSIVAWLRKQTHEFRGTRMCKAVFILDGWDEVSLTGNISYQAQLREWLPRLREYFAQRTPLVRVLLTGRPSSEVGTSGVLHKQTPVLTMRPIRPDQLRQFAGRIQERQQSCAANDVRLPWSIDVDRLAPVFEHYERWFQRFEVSHPLNGPKRTERPDQDAPTAASTEVLGNPLLAYLSLRVLAEQGVNVRTVLEKPTALYHELIETTVRHAGKKEDAGLNSTVHRGGEKLRRLLQEVAATISLLRAEAVSYEELALRLDDTALPIRRDWLGNWAADAENSENALRELVVNFYFKGGNAALGCEFLHKSFREYLFAEAIVQALVDAVEANAHQEAPVTAQDGFARDFAPDTVEFILSRRLAYLLAPQWLSREVETHLQWLMAREAEAAPERWVLIRDLIASVYAWWAEGVHLRHQPTGSRTSLWKPPLVDQLFVQAMPFDDPKRSFVPLRTTSLDAHLGHALMRLACMLHTELPQATGGSHPRRARYQRIEAQRARFQPGGDGFFKPLVARIEAEGWRHFGLGDLVSGPVCLRGEILSLSVGFNAQLPGADLQGVEGLFCQLVGANLQGASLKSAFLMGANFVGANLTNASLEDAKLSDVDLSGAHLMGADLTGASLRRSILTNADLSGARIAHNQLSARQARAIVGTPAWIT
jgi:Pentapeptide repeats (8 copies)/TIR domain